MNDQNIEILLKLSKGINNVTKAYAYKLDDSEKCIMIDLATLSRLVGAAMISTEHLKDDLECLDTVADAIVEGSSLMLKCASEDDKED